MPIDPSSIVNLVIGVAANAYLPILVTVVGTSISDIDVPANA